MYYITVHLCFAGDMYDVAGPFRTYQEAEQDFDMFYENRKSDLCEDEYLKISYRNENL